LFETENVTACSAVEDVVFSVSIQEDKEYVLKKSIRRIVL